ncbi:MAG: HlyC/CorC family transporter [Clostridia bacterium]|nr:HlyC/CorC family transporter [Clostridia bacterium]
MNPYLGIVLLMIGSAFFSSAEIAYASVNKSRLKKAAEAGDIKAQWAVDISDHYDKALCSVLIGNNLVNIASSSVATVVAMALVGDAGVAIATFVMTVLLLIFGEILPKQLAKKFSDPYALAISPILRIFMWITAPLVHIFMKFMEKLSHLWGGASDETSITYEDLVTIIETVEEEGVIDEDQSELLQSAIEFDETEVQEIVTHRTELTALDINDSLSENIEIALKSEFSRIPVYDDTIDDIIGVLPVSNLLKALLDEPAPDIRSLLSEPEFVPQTRKLPEALEQMRQSQNHILIVTDNYGGTLGIVTMEDILEELVGDIWDETDEIDPDIVENEDGSLTVDGTTMLSDLLDHVEIEDPELEDYVITVSGYITEVLDDYPEVGDTFRYRNLVFTILETEDLCATNLRVDILPEEKKEE